MSTTGASSDATIEEGAGTVDLKLEAVVIPVADVDRAKAFYESLEWRLDADFAFDNGFRVVQFTPPSRGVEVSEVFHPGTSGAQFQAAGSSGRFGGPDGDHASYGSFATFSDPDGNGWLLQEITTRLPGRIDTGETSFASVNDLMNALLRAATAHGEHEKRTGQPDEKWPEWYAAYMVAEQNGRGTAVVSDLGRGTLVSFGERDDGAHGDAEHKRAARSRSRHDGGADMDRRRLRRTECGR